MDEATLQGFLTEAAEIASMTPDELYALNRVLEKRDGYVGTLARAFLKRNPAPVYH